MHDKNLTLLAKVLPHMFARWRLFGDFEILADLPDGEVEIDVMTGTAHHSSGGPIVLRIAQELKAGFASQLEKKGIPQGEVIEAVVNAVVDTSKVKTNRRNIVHFDFRISSRIRTAAGLFEAAQTEEHVWHSRESITP
ncbi:MAG: hypothetical protein M3Y08_14095 [Fibrobacterota bacterium]|nr:hypothetical protein [Fibrobacterota bacterium]